MQIFENISLKLYSTFHIGGPARFLIYADTVMEIAEALVFAKARNLPHIILGGGSNVLIHDRGYDGIVIKPHIIGKDIIAETSTTIDLKVGSGEKWDDIVKWACENNWWGIENLSHIPGSVGGFCVQNVGAYGQEASEVVLVVEVYDKKQEQCVLLSQDELGFKYRKSIFNSTEKDKFIILNIFLRLQKTPQPNFSYLDLAQKFNHINGVKINDIRDEVIKIRNSKFPFPDKPKSGNVGSFIRGPILNEAQYQNLIFRVNKAYNPTVTERLKNMGKYLRVKQGYKTPTALLVELCGLRGREVGGAKIHNAHGAVIFNFTGQARSQDVYKLFLIAQENILTKFCINLEIEPVLIGFD